MVTKKPKGLGRGLEALLGPKVDDKAAQAEAVQTGQPSTLNLDQMVAGQYQPRTRMDEGALYELAESIKAQGIMQPILVRLLARGERRQVRNHRRRAPLPRLAAGGPGQVPVLVRDVPDEAAAAMALIENIQREDLNPLEEAQGLARLVQEFGLTHEQAAQAVGRSALGRLQSAAPAEPGRSGADHADGRRYRHGPCPCAAGAGPAGQITAGNQIAARKLSVREAEGLVKKITEENDGTAAAKAKKVSKSRDVQRVEEAVRPADGPGGSARQKAREAPRQGAGHGRGGHPVRIAGRAQRADRTPARLSPVPPDTGSRP
jgi:ParB family chromosome partitioning protein